MTSLILGHGSMLGEALKSLLDDLHEDYITVGRHWDSDIRITQGSEPAKLLENHNSTPSVDSLFVLSSSFEADTAAGISTNILTNSSIAAYALSLAEAFRPLSIVYSGSVSSYEAFDAQRGLSSYGLTKRIVEDLLAWYATRSGSRFASVRFSQLVDNRGRCVTHQPWIGRIIRYAFENGHLFMPHSEGKRNFLHVDDAARLLAVVQRSPHLAGVLNGCSPTQYSYHDLALVAFSFNECLHKLHLDAGKEPFRPVCAPDEVLLYELIDDVPSVTLESWIERIAMLKSWGDFGPMDVEKS